jgi:hypothetical protein
MSDSGNYQRKNNDTFFLDNDFMGESDAVREKAAHLHLV